MQHIYLCRLARRYHRVPYPVLDTPDCLCRRVETEHEVGHIAECPEVNTIGRTTWCHREEIIIPSGNLEVTK
jgi:hypothetical protein